MLVITAVRTFSRRIAVRQFSQSATASTKHPFFERTITIDSRPTLVVQAGYMGPDGAPSPDKTLLVNSCSVGTAISDYRRVMADFPRLLPGWSVVGWDQPGRGKSKLDSDVQAPLDFFERTAQMGIDLMETLGVQKYAVMGYSSGCVSAIMVAAQRPQNVLALICSNGSTELKSIDYYTKYVLTETAGWPASLKKSFEDEYGAAELQRLWLETIEGYKAIRRTRDGKICKDYLPKIECPTLLMHGEKDVLVSMEEELAICGQIANCEVMEMADGRHDMHITRSDEFNRLVTDWMRRVI